MSSNPPNATDAQSDGFRKLIDAVFEEAKVKAETTITEAYQKSLDILAESEKYSQRRSDEILASYRDIAKIEARKEVSKAEINARMSLLKLKESQVDAVLETTRERLQSFTESAEYKTLVLDGIKSITKSVPIGQVLLNEADITKLGKENLKRVAGHDVQIVAQNLGTGGFIAITKDSKASIDRSIDSILESEKQSFRGRIAELLFG